MRKGLGTISLIAIIAVVAAGVGVFVTKGVKKPATIRKYKRVRKPEGHFENAFLEDTGLALFDVNPANFEENFYGNGTIADYSLNAVANETVQSASDASDNGWIDLDNDNLTQSISVTVWNQTGNAVIDSSNYKINYTAGSIELASAVEAANTEVTIDYAYMPTQPRDKLAAGFYFEIDGRTNGGTLRLDKADSQYAKAIDLRSAALRNYQEKETVKELPEYKIESGSEIQLPNLRDGEYRVRIEVENEQFTPNPTVGCRKAFDLNLELESESDDPTEIPGFNVYTCTEKP